jgi:peroxiredoxin
MRFLTLVLVSVLFIACGDAGNTTTVSADASAGAPSFTAPVTGDLESPDIRVEIAGVPLPGALLIGQFMEQQYRAGEASVDGNAIVFKQDEPFKPGHYYAYFTDGTGVQMLIDEDQTFSLKGQKGDLSNSMQVSGSKTNELLYQGLSFETSQQPEFQRLGGELRNTEKGSAAYESLQAQRAVLVSIRQSTLGKLFDANPNSLFTSFKRAGQNPALKEIRLSDGTINEEAQVVAFRNEFWDGVNFSDDRLLRTPVVFNKLKRYVTELTPQNADAIKESMANLMAKVPVGSEFYKFIANWVTLQYEPGKSTVMDAEAIHVYMIQNHFTRETAFWADSMTVFGLQQRADQMAHSLVGQKGPDITVPGVDGKGKRLFDLKKPYIAVFMYNPDCEHCIEQTPKLMAAYQQLKGELDIYAIALDTEASQWKTFIKKYGMESFTNVFDPSNRSIFKTYYVDNTPELYLLGPDRTIVSKNLKVEQLADAIRIAKNNE